MEYVALFTSILSLAVALTVLQHSLKSEREAMLRLVDVLADLGAPLPSNPDGSHIAESGQLYEEIAELEPFLEAAVMTEEGRGSSS